MSLECKLAAGIDPLGWMALADLLEERGDSAAAELWRRRAGCLRVVLHLRAVAESKARPSVWRLELVPGWVVVFYLTRREVRATLMRVPSSLFPEVIGRYHLPRASLLGQTQRDPKMAARYLRSKAFEWAEILTAGVAKG